MAAGLALFLRLAAAQPVDPAVVGERLQRLSATLESVELSQASQKRQMDNLGNEVQRLRQEVSQASRDMASQGSRRPWAEDTKRLSDDVKRLAEAIAEVDRKRASDHEQVLKILADLRRAIAAAAETPAPRTRGPETPALSGRGKDREPHDKDKDKEPEKETPASEPDKYVEHVVQAGQTLSLIVNGFNNSARKQGYKTLTTDQVAKFNKIRDVSKIPEGMKLKLPLVPAPK